MANIAYTTQEAVFGGGGKLPPEFDRAYAGVVATVEDKTNSKGNPAAKIVIALDGGHEVNVNLNLPYGGDNDDFFSGLWIGAFDSAGLPPQPDTQALTGRRVVVFLADRGYDEEHNRRAYPDVSFVGRADQQAALAGGGWKPGKTTSGTNGGGFPQQPWGGFPQQQPQQQQPWGGFPQQQQPQQSQQPQQPQQQQQQQPQQQWGGFPQQPQGNIP